MGSLKRWLSTPLAQVRRRGQVLVLACVTMLLCALMLMFSFSLTQAIHEKIRIQSHADSAAYSIAVMEARGLNTIAYTNRAIAAAMVAQSAIHAWMAIASVQVSLHSAFSSAFDIVAIIELGQCLECCIYCCMQHCTDADDAWNISQDHSDKSDSVGQKVKGLEGEFNDAVGSLAEMVRTLKKGEDAVAEKVSNEVKAPGQMLKKLQGINAPKSQYITAVLALNEDQFACALEGSKLNCSGGGGTINPSRSESDKDLRSKLMQNSSNAALPGFERSTSQPMNGTVHDDFHVMSDYLQKIQTNEGMHMFSYTTKSRVSDDSNSGVGIDNKLENAGGFAEGGTLTVQWRDGAGKGRFDAKIISDTNSGEHEPGGAHSGSHNKMISCSDEDCFINFRAVDDKDKDFGQPSTYAAVKQDLRLITKSVLNSDKGPWELNQEGTVKIQIINGKTTTVTLVPKGMGFAVAKGKAYYHQLGDQGWKNAPNLFDPFWRAKLHPFKRKELATVLETAQDQVGQEAINGGAPVEGDPR